MGRTAIGQEGSAPDGPLIKAVLKFERGQMQLALLGRECGFVWFQGPEPFGPPLPTIEAAVRFLTDLCELYNRTLDLSLPPDRFSRSDVPLFDCE